MSGSWKQPRRQILQTTVSDVCREGLKPPISVGRRLWPTKRRPQTVKENHQGPTVVRKRRRAQTMVATTAVGLEALGRCRGRPRQTERIQPNRGPPPLLPRAQEGAPCYGYYRLPAFARSQRPDVSCSTAASFDIILLIIRPGETREGAFTRYATTDPDGQAIDASA
jgi:hypothetical protein